MSSVRSNKQNI